MPRRSPARRNPREHHSDRVEPKQGMEFLLRPGERTKIRRVVRQGTPEHGQDLVWCVEYELGRERILTWIMYDQHRREWADARLVQDEALARGEPIYAAPSKVPPLGPIP